MSSSPKPVEITDQAGSMVSIGLAVRCVIGGILMGLANLVPGISGGTMLLASGVYPDFVDSVAGITTLRRRLRPWIIALLVGVPAVVAIGLLAATVRDSVLENRWIAYSLFIGLTLGGVSSALEDGPASEQEVDDWVRGSADTHECACRDAADSSCNW